MAVLTMTTSCLGYSKMLAKLNWGLGRKDETYVLLVNRVDRHDVGVSALKLLTVELNVLFLRR